MIAIASAILFLYLLSMKIHSMTLKPLPLKAVLIFAIIIITAFTYADVRNHEFLNIDDNKYVVDNINIQKGLTVEAIRWAFSFTGVAYWHPLTWISHTIDCSLFGVNSGAHHMVNVAFHILNSVMLFLILSRVSGAPFKAAMVATMFAVHPLNVESVAWVTERKMVLSTFFLMISFYLYMIYVGKKNVGVYILILCTYSLGLMSKPGILPFPFLLLLFDYWPLRRISGRSLFESDAAYPKASLKYVMSILHNIRSSGAITLVLEKVPFVILSLLSTYLSMLSMTKYGIVASLDRVTLDLRIYNLLVTIMKYIGLTVWPVELSIFYPFPESISMVSVFLASLAVVIISGTVIVFWKKRPWLATGWFWFLISLAPAGGLVQAGLWPEMANRFMYIPMIGLLIMVVWEFDDRLRGRYSKALKILFGLLSIVYFSSLTRVQNLYYSNSYALFTRSVAVTGGNVIAYNGIGAALVDLNKLDEAMMYFEKALAINPAYANALNNCGIIYSKRKEYEKAEYYYKRTIDADPQWAVVYLNYAVNQINRGLRDEAKKLIDRALELDPRFSLAHYNRALLFEEEGKTDEAIGHFKQAIENSPNLLQARMSLSLTYEKAGRYEDAFLQYQQLIEIVPSEKGVTYYRMAGLRSKQHRYEESKNYLELSQKNGFNVLENMKADKHFDGFRNTELYKGLINNRE